MRFNKSTLAVLAAAGLASAQTSTDCNPLDKSCPADPGLDASSYSIDFTKGQPDNSSWSVAQGTTITYGSKGAEFTISKAGQAPTIQTDFYFFFGTVEVKMQAAPGTGIVSSIVLESDDLDEIDWEMLGGDTTQAETNYFGKGDTTTYDRAIYYPVSSPQTTVHTYTIDWSSSAIVFAIDGTVVRTLNYADAKGGSTFPQTPMRLKLGNWAGGAPGEPAGTVEWAGGATEFSNGPFSMYVQSVKITNANPGKEYVYGDKTGSWQSIKVGNGSGTSELSAVGASSSSNSSSSASASGYANSKTSASGTATSIASHGVAAAIQTGTQDSKTITGTVTGKTGSATADATSAAKSSAAASATGESTLHTSTKGSLPTAGTYKAQSNSTVGGNSSSSAQGSSGAAHQTTSGAAMNTIASAVVSMLGLSLCFWML